MVCHFVVAMVNPWRLFGFHLYNVVFVLFLFKECCSLNAEVPGKVVYDPFGVFGNWNPGDDDPCEWNGVHCVANEVDALNLNGMFLGGTLVPELGNLSHLRALYLCQNNFSGAIPKEIGRLTMLMSLDLRNNNLSGNVPTEISELPLLRTLLLCHNQFHDDIPPELGKHSIFCKSEYEGDCFLSNFPSQKSSSEHHAGKHGKNLEIIAESYIVDKEEDLVHYIRRKLLKAGSNLAASVIKNYPIQNNIDTLATGSGSFPAMPSIYYKNSPSLPPEASFPEPPTSPLPATTRDVRSILDKLLSKWQYILVLVAIFILLIVVAALIAICRSQSVATIGPWHSELSGQLRKALIAGVPQLNRIELEAACEDFSNIMQSYPECTVYKGTLSSGVEIAVVSTTISSSKDWSKRSESYFREKLGVLSRINHKNFINLLGYCVESEPFTRMMVFEFASSGTLYEHLHAKGLEHLDWNIRVRIIMGVAYCLQYMHHELRPPVAHTNLQSGSIFLTDDYAAKIVEIEFWKEVVSATGEEPENSSKGPSNDPRSNVYSFGLLLLEIISGRPTQTEEGGSIVNWAAERLIENQSTTYLVDPTLTNFKNEEVDVIYEVIQECVNQDPKKRPTMKDVTSKLRQVIAISPEAAAPRLSPLWWAELEILSVEAS